MKAGGMLEGYLIVELSDLKRSPPLVSYCQRCPDTSKMLPRLIISQSHGRTDSFRIDADKL